MRPSTVAPGDIDAWLEAGHWSTETMVDRYRGYAAGIPDRTACRDAERSWTWAELDAAAARIAESLAVRGVPRDARAVVQMPSSCREIVLRIGFKKAGIIGVFVPVQWRRKELDYVFRQVEPAVLAMHLDRVDPGVHAWTEAAAGSLAAPRLRIDLSPGPPLAGWLGWDELVDRRAADDDRLAARAFSFDEVSLITASSGTSGLAKLCEWPEGAQMCAARGLAARFGIDGGDTIGVFAPMSGAAGLLPWTASGAVPCSYTFPASYKAADLLDEIERSRVTLGTTVPVVLARLAGADLEGRDLGSLRALRVGTAAADMSAAHSFERRTGCRVVVASGSMECPGFSHAGIDEPVEVRLDGSVGLPLPGGELRIVDDDGADLPAGGIGELLVRAPYRSSGYWRDPEATAASWTEGWYASGDVGRLDGSGRLTLLGRKREVINRSGHKILPVEIEREISGHPDVFECAVVKAPDAEYGEAAWAFVQCRPGAAFDEAGLVRALRERGLARYKIPARFVEVADFPRIGGSKIDKARLLASALASGGG